MCEQWLVGQWEPRTEGHQIPSQFRLLAVARSLVAFEFQVAEFAELVQGK